jgi:hypothetical protein
MCLSGRRLVVGSYVPFKEGLLVGSLCRCGRGLVVGSYVPFR